MWRLWHPQSRSQNHSYCAWFPPNPHLLTRVFSFQGCSILTSLFASLFLDWLLGVDPTTYGLLIRVLNNKGIVKEWNKNNKVCKWPGDQSSRSQRCRGGQTLAPAARSQAQRPAVDQSVIIEKIYLKTYISLKYIKYIFFKPVLKI